MNSTFRESFLDLFNKYSNYTEMLERENATLKEINAKLQNDMLEKIEVIKKLEEEKP